MASKRAWKHISHEHKNAFIELEDSEHDTEFTAGAYVEPKRKRRKRTQMQVTGKNRSTLLEYFGDTLDSRALEDDQPATPAISLTSQYIAIEDSDENSGSEYGGSSQGNASQTLTKLVDQPSSSPPPPPQTQVDISESSTESETEPETEPDLPVQHTAVAKVASKDSITESESDGDFFTQSQTQHSTQQWQTQRVEDADDESATATETESEDDHGFSLQDLRPSFVRRADQNAISPLVLDEATGIAIPGAINTFLREYQRDGVKFFYRQYQQGKGALLGDDMGLVCKTIQVISFLSALMEKTGSSRDAGRRRRHIATLQDLPGWQERRELPSANETWPTALIVAPSTVVGNWEREFETWGYFEVGLYTGLPKFREQVLNNFKLGRLDIMVTSFETARNDIEHLNNLAWTFVFVDEAHRLKNPSSSLTRAFTTFQCRMRIALTGTAIQNTYAELWTLLDWTNPGLVGTYDEWRQLVEDPLKDGQSSKSSEEVQAKARLVSQALHSKLLPKFWLRRTKDIIKDQLPKKFDHVVFCPLTETQRHVYRTVLALEQMQNMILKDDPCDCGSRLKRGKCCHKWDKADLLRFLDTLIKISNHLCLILPYHGDTPEQIQRNRDLAAMIYPGKKAPKYAQASMEAELCGKWIVLQTLMKEWREDPLNKVLIFTKSIKLLNVLEFHLKNHGYGLLRLDGSTKQSERMPMIDQFHADPNITIFLISTQAGGVGLNLTGANRVVIFDPNWNPAHDLQAMDRAYRFGQTRDVYVYRLLGAGSIEEIIYARQLYKQQQMAIGYDASVQTRYFEGVQKGHEGELFGLKNMFRLQETDLVTKRVIEKAHVTALDWALENIQPEKLKENWVYKAESSKSTIDRDLGGLGALLLDDSAKPAMNETTESHRINMALREKGIKYHHRNDQVLAENPVERQRTTKAIQNRKPRKSPKKKQAACTKTMVHEDSWPPRRVHHKTTVTVVGPDSEDLLDSRRFALQALGYIADVDNTTSFAEAFAKMPQHDQEIIIAKLDDYTTGL